MDATYFEQLRQGCRLEELLKLLPPKVKERLTDVATGMVMAQNTPMGDGPDERKSA